MGIPKLVSFMCSQISALNPITFPVSITKGEEQPDIYLGQSQIEEVVNATLMNAFHKNSAAWNKLDRAQQARIADIIATKKEKLLNLLLNHEGCVVTSADMKSILARAMTET